MGFIDDIVNGVTKEVEKVQVRSQEMLQGYNLQTQIRDLERKRTAKLLEIGHLNVDKYHNHKDVSEDSIKDKVAEVAGYDHEISLLQAEVDAIKAANDPSAPASQKAETKAGFKPTPGFECPSCHAPASRDKAFCPICGASLKDAKAAASDGTDVIDVEPTNN
jgi:hypothetical protein